MNTLALVAIGYVLFAPSKKASSDVPPNPKPPVDNSPPKNNVPGNEAAAAEAAKAWLTVLEQAAGMLGRFNR